MNQFVISCPMGPPPVIDFRQRMQVLGAGIGNPTQSLVKARSGEPLFIIMRFMMHMHHTHISAIRHVVMSTNGFYRVEEESGIDLSWQPYHPRRRGQPRQYQLPNTDPHNILQNILQHVEIVRFRTVEEMDRQYQINQTNASKKT